MRYYQTIRRREGLRTELHIDGREASHLANKDISGQLDYMREITQDSPDARLVVTYIPKETAEEAISRALDVYYKTYGKQETPNTIFMTKDIYDELIYLSRFTYPQGDPHIPGFHRHYTYKVTDDHYLAVHLVPTLKEGCIIIQSLYDYV